MNLISAVQQFIVEGALVDDLEHLATLLYEVLMPILTSKHPDVLFTARKAAVNGKLQDICGSQLMVTQSTFDLFKEVAQVVEKTSSVTDIKSEPTLAQTVRAKALFRDLYVRAAQVNQEALNRPETTLTVLKLLLSERPSEDIQYELIELMGYENVEVVSEMLEARATIVQAVNALRAQPTIAAVQKPTSAVTVTTRQKKSQREEKRRAKKQEYEGVTLDILVQLGFDLDYISGRDHDIAATLAKVYESDETFMAGIKRSLPANMQVVKTRFYTEYIMPPPEPKRLDEASLISTDIFEDWARPAFKGMRRLNPMQTKVFETAYFSNDNLLVSAPTGAGKTVVALITVLRVLKLRLEQEGHMGGDFKIVYVAPMKALASEVTAKFGAMLQHLGVKVRELTGDMQLTRAEMAATQIIVTTPEKWDVVTRKSESIAPQVKLLILDEIHLLDDERGAVLEAVVARTLRLVESIQSMIRILGLSATLPNYADVGRFIRAPAHAIFNFDGEYRPIPLEQRFIGCKVVSNSTEQANLFLEACFDKVMLEVRAGHQVLVFVHSRRDTVKTAEALKNFAIATHQVNEFDAGYLSAFKREVDKSKNRELRALFESGIGIHNAGMLRKDRNLTEKLFKEKQIKVLVTTATLAWGVNLPAHAVIIKGTEIYDSSAGGFKDIGVLDVQQIFGRAGRPDYDTSGVATIITTAAKLPLYLKMLVQKVPIESRFLSKLEDYLNAEISLGTIASISDALWWLTYTYCYVRASRNPLCYGISLEEAVDTDKLHGALTKKLLEVAAKLNSAKMVRLTSRAGALASTQLGRIASNYYIKTESIMEYNIHLDRQMTGPKLLWMFAESHEFRQLKVREEEQNDLRQLSEAVQLYLDIDKAHLYTVEGKVLTLLFAYLEGMQPEAFSLVSDMAYVVQNGTRILRAIFEICLKNYWPEPAQLCLELCRTVDRRVGHFHSPLRQFTASGSMGGYTASTSSQVFKGGFLKDETLMMVEKFGITPESALDMDSRELAHLLHHDTRADEVKRFARYLPYIELQPQTMPLTSTVVKIHIVVKPLFEWHNRWHGGAQSYWVWVEDSEDILHFEHFVLLKSAITRGEEPTMTFAVPIIRSKTLTLCCFSEFWVGVETKLELETAFLPHDDSAHTELLDLTPLPKSVLQNKEYEALYKFEYFNPIQTQVLHSLYHHDINVLVGAPTGSGKTITAELAMLRLFAKHPEKKVVYVAPLKALARERIKDWVTKLEPLGKIVVELTGDYTPDIKALNKAHVLITTPEKWDGISRSWQQRSYVQAVGLVVIDEIHLLGQDRGPVLEVIVSRMRYIAAQTHSHCRIVGLSTALANAHDLANWLGVEQLGFFNFRPNVRPVPLEVHVDGFSEKAYCPRMASMNKPAYNAIKTHSPHKPVLIFVSSRRQTRLTAIDLISYAASEGSHASAFLNIPAEEMELLTLGVKDANLRHALLFGIGMHHAGLTESDRTLVEDLFVNERVRVLVATSTLAWGVNFPAHLVIIKGSEYFDAKEQRYVDLPITDILQMMGRAGRPQFDTSGIVKIFCLEEKRQFLKTFLYSPFPVESSLANQLHDHINAEIAAGTLDSKASCMNYLTWTYFFRRLLRNPAYYGLTDNSPEAVNSFLTHLVDSVIGELQANHCITCDEGLETTPLGTIASFYYLHYRSVSLLYRSLRGSLQFHELVRTLTEVHEFSELPVRHNEELLNEELAKAVPFKVNMKALESPHTKSDLLLQAHFSRVKLPIADYITDTKTVLDQAVRVVHGMVDIAASSSTLQTTLKIMSLVQMMTQGQWHYDSSLMNLPGITPIRVSLLASQGVECLGQLVEMGVPQLAHITQGLGLSPQEQQALPKVLAQMPKISLRWKVEKEAEESLWEDSSALNPGDIVPISFTIESLSQATSERVLFNHIGRIQTVGYWLMIGCAATDQVLALKRMQFLKQRVTRLRLNINVPVGSDLRVYWVVHNYLGLDQEYPLISNSA
jgi:activating signal cointegrator complex subunit 3